MKLRNEFTVPAAVELAWEVLLDLERVAPCLPGAQLDRGDGCEYQGRMAIKLGPMTSRYRGTVRIEQADAAGRRAVMRAQARDASGAGTAAATISTTMRAIDGGTLVTVDTDIQISGAAAQFGRGVMQEVSAKLMGRFAACLAEEMAGGQVGDPWEVDANQVTAAQAGSGSGARAGGAPATVDWSAAGLARAPTRLGGYEETPVGRLPTGPAGDAALAAARAHTSPARPRRAEEVLDLGELSRAALLKRALPAVGLILVAGGALVALRARSRRARR